MKLDVIDNAENLIKIVEHYMGVDSDAIKTVKHNLLRGFSPQEIAAELRNILNEPNK